MTPLFANNASTTLAAGISSSATTVLVAVGTGAEFPSPTTGQYFTLTLNDQATGEIYEICYCTARTGDSLTVLRGQEGTTAVSWLLGDYAYNAWTAATITGIINQAVGGVLIGTLPNPGLAASVVSNTNLTSGAAVANLGFTPPQQGGGIGQSGDKINIGWDSSIGLVKLTVDTSYDAGGIITDTIALGGALTGLLPSPGLGSGVVGPSNVAAGTYGINISGTAAYATAAVTAVTAANATAAVTANVANAISFWTAWISYTSPTRQLNTVYTNSLSTPIMVSVLGDSNVNDQLQFEINGVFIARTPPFTSGVGVSVTCIVPAGAAYLVNSYLGNITFDSWYELR